MSHDFLHQLSPYQSVMLLYNNLLKQQEQVATVMLARGHIAPSPNCLFTRGPLRLRTAGSLALLQFPTQNGTTIPSAVFQGSSVCPTDRYTQTDHATCVAIGYILCYAWLCVLITMSQHHRFRILHLTAAYVL